MNRLSLLEYFYSVAKEGSITKGARSLGITQPTVTKMIKELELVKGVSLFNRHARGVSLTEHGDRLFDQCNKLYEISETIFNNQKAISKRRTIRIGIEDFLCSNILLDKIEIIRSKFSCCDLELVVGTTDELYIKLQNRNLDFIFSFYRPRLKRITFEKLKEYKQILVSNKKISKGEEYIFIGQRQINTKEYRELPTFKFLLKTGYKLNKSLSSNSLSFTKNYLVKNKAISLLPFDFIREELKSKSLVQIEKKYEFHSTLKLAFTDESPNDFIQYIKSLF